MLSFKRFAFLVVLFLFLAACRQSEATPVPTIQSDGYMPISWVEVEVKEEGGFAVTFSNGEVVSGQVMFREYGPEVIVAGERTCSFFEYGVSSPIREVSLTGVTCSFEGTYRSMNVYAPAGATISKVEGIGRYTIYTGILFPVDRELTVAVTEYNSHLTYQVVKIIPELPIVNSGEVRYVLTDQEGKSLCEISYFEGGMGADRGELPCITLLSPELDGIAGFSGEQGGVILLGDFLEVTVK